MTSPFTKASLVLAAFAALPGVAHAGTATATGAATFNVASQCTVTGATVNLGTYTASQTWGDVGAALGKYTTAYTAGSLGTEALNFGSITCDAGAPFIFQITGTASSSANAIKITLNGKTAVFAPHIRKLGGVTVADNSSWVGIGAQVHSLWLSGTGTGAVQTLMGSAPLHFTTGMTTALPTDVVGAAGSATDTLTYTLTF